MKKTTTFGELLLRLSPVLNGEWLRAQQMPVYLGGAELNVATALAAWQQPVKYITALPDHHLTQEIIAALAEKQIDVSGIVKTGNRIGSYYLPQGADLKNAGVIYDRAGSSFSGLTPGTIHWQTVFEDSNWFHFTAINPALNEKLVTVCAEAITIAKQKGLTVSVDLNYRSKLWQYGKNPVQVMPELVSHCNVLMGNIWAAESLLGIPASIKDSAGKTPEDLVAAAEETIARIKTAFPEITVQAHTFRLETTYFGVLHKEGKTVVSPVWPLTSTIDKAGSGDCFMAALIYGLQNELPLQRVVDFAAAAATGKMQEKGDATQQSVAEIEQRITTHA